MRSLGAVFDLDRIVAGQLASLSTSGRMLAAAASCSVRNCGAGGQQIAARGAFGAADLQQQGGDLVFDLDGVHHQALSSRALLTSKTEADADRDQHQKSRRKQQDLPHSAPALSVSRHNDLASWNKSNRPPWQKDPNAA